MKNTLTPEEYLNRFQATVDHMLEITKKKNHDYSWTDNAFKNFELIEEITGWKVNTANGIVVRITDKIARLGNLLHRDAKVEDEKITDTLEDAANYLIILKKIIVITGMCLN